MAMKPEEARVLAVLVEKEATVPDSYPLTLHALRLGCNQTTNRHPVVAYEDRVVEAALVGLKSIGLVRFVHPSHGGRTIRYRHVADERWHLEADELGVLATLVLRGPQTAAEVRARTGRLRAGAGDVDELLDTLAARSPEPLVTRLPRRVGERDARWAHVLCGDAVLDDGGTIEPDVGPAPPVIDVEAVAGEVALLRKRLDRLEEMLGVEPDAASS